MASLHSLALHSTLFLSDGGKMVNEEKKLCDDDSTTVGASAAVVPLLEALPSTAETTTTTTPARLRSSHRYLQQRLNKHGGNLKRRFSGGNLAELGKTEQTEHSDALTLNDRSDAVELVEVNTLMIESEPETTPGDTRGRRKFTKSKRERMQKMSQYRSISATKPRSVEPESLVVEPESLTATMDPVNNKRDRRFKTTKLRSKSKLKTQSTENESADVVLPVEIPPHAKERIAKPRSVSIPRERAQRLSLMRSRSDSKARPTEKMLSESKFVAQSPSRPEVATRQQSAPMAIGNPETHVPKFLQGKIARMRQSDNFRRRLGSASSVENDSVRSEELTVNGSSSKEAEVQTISSKESDTSCKKAEATIGQQHDDAVASQLASIEDQLMNPSNSSLNPKNGTAQIDKSRSKLARRNRIKQKPGYRIHSRTPSPHSSRPSDKPVDEPKSNSVESEREEIVGAMSPVRSVPTTEATTEKRSESYSPLPRLRRFKQRTEQRKFRAPSPIAKVVAVAVTLEEKDKEEVLSVVESTQRSDDEGSTRSRSVSPGPRVGRLRQLDSYSLVKNRTLSPKPSRSSEDTFGVVNQAQLRLAQQTETDSNGASRESPRESVSLSPVHARKAFDPIGSRSPPLPRPKVSSSLSPIPRGPRTHRSIRTEEGPTTRDPPARLVVPDISTDPKVEHDVSVPVDPDAITPRGNSPRNGFCFDFEDVHRAGRGAQVVETNEKPDSEVVASNNPTVQNPEDDSEVEAVTDSGTTQIAYLDERPAEQAKAEDEADEDIIARTNVDEPAENVLSSVVASDDSEDADKAGTNQGHTGEKSEKENVEVKSEAEPDSTIQLNWKPEPFPEDATVDEGNGPVSGENVVSSNEGKISLQPSTNTLVSTNNGELSSEETRPLYQDSIYQQYIVSPDAATTTNCRSFDFVEAEEMEEATSPECSGGEHVEAGLLPVLTSGDSSLAKKMDQSDTDEVEPTSVSPIAVQSESNDIGSASEHSQCDDVPEQSSHCPIDATPSGVDYVQESVSNEPTIANFSDQVKEPEERALDDSKAAETWSQICDAEMTEISENITHCSTEEVRIPGTTNIRSAFSHEDVSDAGSVRYESFTDSGGIELAGSFSPRKTLEGDEFGQFSKEELQENVCHSETPVVEPVVGCSIQIEEPRFDIQVNFPSNEELHETPLEEQNDFASSSQPCDNDIMNSQTLSAHSALEVQHANDQSEGVDLSAIENPDPTIAGGYRVSNVELAQLRHAAATSSIFDDTSSLANTESTFTAATTTGTFVRRTESREFKDCVQTNLGLGPLEEGPEQTPKGGTPLSRGDDVVDNEVFSIASPSELRRSPESKPPPQSMVDDPDVQAQLLLMPPPPPPEGKKVKKKKKRSRSAKRKTKDKDKNAESPNDKSKLEFPSDDSEDEDLANFIESLGESPSKETLQKEKERDDLEQSLTQEGSPLVLHDTTSHIPAVENVSSNTSCASFQQAESLDIEKDGVTLMVPVEKYSESSTDHGVSAPSLEPESMFGPTELRASAVSRERVISPVSAAKVLHDSKLAEKVDNAISMAAAKLEHRASDQHSANEPGSIIELPEPEMLHSVPVKLTRSRASSTPWAEVNDPPRLDPPTSSKRYIIPEGRPSPFEAIVFLKPEVIGQILDFLGDPVEVCRMKGLNRTCFYYIEDNQHKLMQRAVRLGGMSMGQRPAFWMWVVLSVSQRHAEGNSNSLPSESDTSLAENWGGEDLVRLQKIGRSGKWSLIIERDVSRSFGNLPPHKTGARLRTDSIVRALVSYGRNRTVRTGVRGSGPAPIPSRNASCDSEDDLSQAPTDTVSDWGGVSPTGSFGTMSSEQQSKNASKKEVQRTRADDELALSGNVLTDETKEVLQKKLSFILHALSAAHSEIGYCQGMDYVVAHLLRLLQETVKLHAAKGTLPSCVRSVPESALVSTMSQTEIADHLLRIDRSLVLEETCFRMMDILLTKYNLGHFYWPELRCLKTCCRVFEKLIQIKLPVLADHFEHHELNVGLFALGWFQTLFLYLPSMPTATVCHMWDIWLVERSFKIFFRVATAILFLSQPILLNHELEGMMSYLNTFPDATLLSPDILIACALQIKVTNRMLMELEQEVVNESYV